MTLEIDLSDQVALVTGSSRGIGLAIAERLGSAGCNVIINARKLTGEIEDLRDSIASRYNVRCEAFSANVSDAAEVTQMFQNTFKTFKKLDILVNNAGILRDGLIGMISQENVEATIATNAVGTINCIQASARLLQRNGGGSIVNITSIIGVRGNLGQLVYGASKGAVIAATLSAAKELAAKQIRVNAIAPGYIETEMIKDIPEETHQERMDSIAMGRIGTPDDVANAALFLASPLSSYVTGVILGVDGGMLI